MVTLGQRNQNCRPLGTLLLNAKHFAQEPPLQTPTHSKLITKQHLPGFTVSLWRRYRNGSVEAFTVMARATSRHTARKRSRHSFVAETEARTFFEQVCHAPQQALQPHANTVHSHLEEARAIVLAGATWTKPVTLQLLLAVQRVRSISQNTRYHQQADAICKILHHKTQMPHCLDEAKFFAWVRECLTCLLTTRLSAKGELVTEASISQDTAKHRVLFFNRALQTLLVYFWGHWQSGISDSQVKNFL